MKIYYIEYRQGRAKKYAKIESSSFGQARRDLLRDKPKATDVQQISAGYYHAAVDI